jgi:TBC1 domain family member 23
MPCALEQADVLDFCSLAQYYSIKTPSSFKTDWLKILFSSAETASRSEEVSVSQALCLPVSVYELVENSSMENPHPEAVKFFLVDCRPSEQYNVGHLSTAFHLDCNLMLQEPVQFQTAVAGLLRAQKHAIEVNSAAGGEHLCFLGSGRLDEDMMTHMVVASFLQKGGLLSFNFPFISDFPFQAPNTFPYLPVAMQPFTITSVTIWWIVSKITIPSNV